MSVSVERLPVAVQHAVAIVVEPAARREQPPRLARRSTPSGGGAPCRIQRMDEAGPYGTSAGVPERGLHHQPAVERQPDGPARIEVAQDRVRRG